MHPAYRTDIDGLRAIAVLAVVGFHAFPEWVKGGFVGVDVFFVISGFLISTIIFDGLQRDRFSFVEFYGRRIRRILPALILVLGASVAFGWFALLPPEYKQLGKHVVGGAGFVSNLVFWKETGYFDNAAETKPLLHLWSLAIEEQYYIVWPLLLWIAWKRRLNLLTITSTLMVVSFALNVVDATSNRVAAFYSPQTRFWELLIGSILAHVTLYTRSSLVACGQRLDCWLGSIIYAMPPQSKGSTLRDVQSLVGGTLIGIGILAITKESRFPGWWALLPTLGSALIISAGTRAWLNRVFLGNRVMVWVGLISYPLYLWHWPVLSFARVVEGETPTLAGRTTAVAASFILAWLTYMLVERPMRFGPHRAAKSIALLSMMIIVGFAGYASYARDGMPSRFPKIVQGLTQQQYDPTGPYRLGTCYLPGGMDYPAFASCKVEAVEPKGRTLLLWGDSHAAHLYPGYKASYGAAYDVIQRTIALCPPILDLDVPDDNPHGNNPLCRQINNGIFDEIKMTQPRKVVLAAAWTHYKDWQRVEETVSRLRKIGITDIDLIGPVPQWSESLPKQLYLYFKSDKFHRVPERMKLGLVPTVPETDVAASSLASRLGVNYISPLRILCNDDGCVTRLGDTVDSLTAWDYAHLTENGSRFLVSQFPRK